MVRNVLIRNDAEVAGSTKVSTIFMGRFACTETILVSCHMKAYEASHIALDKEK